MVSRIDPTIPPFGKAVTASVRDNFNIAQLEITELQNRVDQIGGGMVDYVKDVPPLPPNEEWARRLGVWVQLPNVYDGGVF